jgi:hypothetical protein
VQETVEDRRRHDGIAEHGAPLADRAIAGEQETAALVGRETSWKKRCAAFGSNGR